MRISDWEGTNAPTQYTNHKAGGSWGTETNCAKAHHHELLVHKRLENKTKDQDFYILSGNRGWVGATNDIKTLRNESSDVETLKDAAASAAASLRAPVFSELLTGAPPR